MRTSEDLKKMPFTTPDGYFEGVNRSVNERISVSRDLRSRIAPYLAMAAMFAMILCAGSLFLRVLSPTDAQDGVYADMSYLDIIPVTDPDMIYYAGNYDFEEITPDDIAEYLIYNGVDIENMVTE
ncbi:MAG: hypothetical protein ACI395_03255 [Candidatus Cryptobacteroides sp.]